jgi:hypothetical protein
MTVIGMKVVATVPYSTRQKHGEVIAMQDGCAIVKWNGCHVTQSVIPKFLYRMKEGSNAPVSRTIS